jgi:NADH:ubiquinone oxidoreductase subunit E
MSMVADNWEAVQSQARAVLGEDVVALIEQCRGRPNPESQLIAVLHRVQGQRGWLAAEQLDAVAQLLQVPAATVAGVASFYHFFRLQPRGRFMIDVCLGTACYVKGGDRIAEKIMDELGIRWGETTKDGVFTLEAARCVGACGLAPIVVIGDEVHGQVTPDQVPAMLEKYLKRAKAG